MTAASDIARRLLGQLDEREDYLARVKADDPGFWRMIRRQRRALGFDPDAPAQIGVSGPDLRALCAAVLDGEA